MQEIIYAHKRGVRYVYVKDDGPNIGYSGRVAYAMGLDKPNYPVPTTIGIVDLLAYPGIVCINTVDGDDWTYAWDQWSQTDVTNPRPAQYPWALD